MSWTRLDDMWTEQKAIADLSLAARWHYLCLIQLCSRSDRYDGVVRLVDTLRCSDVDDPKAVMNEIHRAGLVVRTEEANRVRVVHIDDHVPPPSVRKKSDSDKIRKQRQRLHGAGDHSTCYRQRCEFGVLEEPKPRRTRGPESHVTDPPDTSHPSASPVMSHVTPGQDGTGRDRTGSTEAQASWRINAETGEAFDGRDPWA